MRIVLEDMSQDLDEVVVVGYGTMKKKLLTGATVQIKGDDIQRLNTTTPLGRCRPRVPVWRLLRAPVCRAKTIR